MDTLTNLIININDIANKIVWGPHMLILLLGTGLYFSVKTNFLQIRKFPHIFKKTILSMFYKTKTSKGAISPFQALTTALASTIGTGNIVGVASAIAIGGPGAVFWIWVSGFLGMMTKYSEVLLSIKYRKRDDQGNYAGGPMYYLKDGLNMKWLGILFSLFGVIASFGIGNIAQINSIATAFNDSFNIEPLFTGVIIAIIISFIIVGGVNRIAKTTEKLVPFMIIFYFGMSLIVLIINFKNIPYAFNIIISHAFNNTAAVGGFAGSTIMLTIKSGIARGIFANEAGLGSSPIAHAAADTKDPVHQSMWGIVEVFIDTILVCTCTALVILTTGVWDNGLNGVNLTISAFETIFPIFASFAVTIAIFCFAFSTLVSWSYYGERCLEFLTGSSRFNVIYKLIYSAIIVIGATSNITLVWDISDTLNGLMAIPNLIGVLGLSGVVIKTTRNYFK